MNEVLDAKVIIEFQFLPDFPFGGSAALAASSTLPPGSTRRGRQEEQKRDMPLLGGIFAIGTFRLRRRRE